MAPHSQILMIAGGGTGGHILAGVAVADEWKKQSFGQVLFVGAKGGLEEKLVPKYGYPIRFLKIGALNKVGLKKRSHTAIQLPAAFLKSIWILLEMRPSAVLGVGGYASGPFVLCAKFLGWLWGCKTAIVEQNSIPGFANRVLGKWVDRVFLAFEWSAQFFDPRKTKVTGNPIRLNFQPLPSGAAHTPFTVFVFGGSQGAVGLNTLVIEALPYLAPMRDKLRWIHQTGVKDYDRVLEAHRKHQTQCQVESFIDDMKSAYQQASLVVSRAGSSSLSEIAAVQRAAIFVPLPTASDNHQEMNAKIFTEAGAGVLVPQTGTSGQEFAAVLESFVKNPSKIKDIEKKAASFYRPGAASEIAQNLLSKA